MSSSVIRGCVRKRSYASLQADKPLKSSGSSSNSSAGSSTTAPTKVPHVLLPDWYLSPTNGSDLPVDVLESAVLHRIEALAAPTGADAALSLDLLASEKLSATSDGQEGSSAFVAGAATASATLNSYLQEAATSTSATSAVAWDALTHLTLRMAIAAAAGADHPTATALRSWWVSAEARVFLGRLRRWLAAKEASSSLEGASSHNGHATGKLVPEYKEWWREFGLDYRIKTSAQLGSKGAGDGNGGGRESGGVGSNTASVERSLVAVPFEHAASLVARRAVKLNRGMAMIPWTEIPMIVAGRFRSHLNQQVLRIAHGAVSGPSADYRFATLFARARVAIAWHAGVDHTDYDDDDNNNGAFGGMHRRHSHGSSSVLGPATLERLMRALQTGALPLCARRLLAALLGLSSQMEASTTGAGAESTTTIDTAANTAATAAIFSASNTSLSRPFGEEEVALRSGWLHHDQRRQLLLFMKDWGLTVGPTAKLFRLAHQRASAGGSDSATGSTSAVAAGHVMVRPKRKWDRYEYDVQHHFGLKGKRAVAPPLPCFDVVRHFAPKPAAHGLGGCPFHDLSTGALTRALMRSYPSSLFGNDSGSGNGSSGGDGNVSSGGGLSSSDAAEIASRAAELHAPTQALNEDGTWRSSSSGDSTSGGGGGHLSHHNHGMSASGAMSLCCKHFDAQHAQAASSRRRPVPRPLKALLANSQTTKTLAMHPHQWAQASERLQHEWQRPEVDDLLDADVEDVLDCGSDSGIVGRPCQETEISW